MSTQLISRPSAHHFVLTALFAFAVVALDPYLMLLFSPIFLGAPHALSDIWYLIVQDSGVPRRVRLALAILSGLVISAGLLVLIGIPISARAESILLITLIALPLAMVTSSRRALPAWIIVSLLAYLLLATEFPLRAVVAHLHNIIALTFLFSLALPLWGRRGIYQACLAVIILCAAGATVSCYSGGVFLVPFNPAVWSPFLSLVFGSAAGIAGCLLFSYAFLQLMHFAVWIWFIPSIKRDLALDSFMRAHGFKSALGALLIALLIVLAAPLAALANPLQARQAYLTLVSFHGWMEIAWLLSHSSFLAGRGRVSFRSAFVFGKPQHA